jgi:hypothetical protein
MASIKSADIDAKLNQADQEMKESFDLKKITHLFLVMEM